MGKLIPFDLRVTLFESGNAIEEHHLTGLYKAHKHLYPDSPAANVTLPIQLDANGLVVIGREEATFQAIEKPKADSKKKQTSAPRKTSKKVSLQDTVEYKWPAPMSRKQRLGARK